jgi:hypothetical protein
MDDDFQLMCDLLGEIGIPLKAPPFVGEYVISDGKGRAYGLIETFIEVVRRLRAAEARITDLEQRQ